MSIENPNFGPGHHGGMPSDKELRWREQVQRNEIEARYGGATFPTTGTIDFKALPVSKAESIAESIQHERDWYRARSD